MTKQKETALGDLIGEHRLDAVDRFIEGNFDDAAAIRFRLDGVVYTAFEDPEDGYRSSMKELCVSSDKMVNVFEPVDVVGVMNSEEVLTLIDVKTKKVVLEVGTADIDDYYPSFVAAFFPENMCINQKAATP